MKFFLLSCICLQAVFLLPTLGEDSEFSATLYFARNQALVLGAGARFATRQDFALAAGKLAQKLGVTECDFVQVFAA